MKRREGVSSRDTDRILREVDRQLRGLTAAAADRTLRTAAPGLGGGMSQEELFRRFDILMPRSWNGEVAATSGCTDDGCPCDELAENWEEFDQDGENLEWTYRRAGRWRRLEGPGWSRDRPRRAWQYDYWRIEDARGGEEGNSRPHISE